MAFEYQGFATLGVNLNRQKYGPLDISNVFTSEADLKYYLTKGTFTEGVSEYWTKVVPYPYEGQVLATVIDGVVSVYALSLNAEGNFQTQEIGAKVEVDGTTIVKDSDGKLSIVAPTDPDSTKTYNFAYANGVYSWVEVDTATAAGQAQAITNLQTRATDLENAVEGLAEDLDTATTTLDGKIAEALQAAKDYADTNDADTIYDDTAIKTRIKTIEDDYLKAADKYDDKALVARVKALEEEERYDETALANRVTAVEEAINTETTGLEARVSAMETFWETTEDTDGIVNKLKEIQDYIASDETGAATMAGNIQTNADAIATLNGDGAGSVNKKIADAIEPLATKVEVADIKATAEAAQTADEVSAAIDAKLETANLDQYAKADDVITKGAFESFKTENTEAITKAGTDAVAAVEAKGYATETAVAATYATKAELAAHEQTAANTYAKTTDVYTTSEVDDLIAGINQGNQESAAAVNTKLTNYITSNDKEIANLKAKDTELATAVENAQTTANQAVADAASVSADLTVAITTTSNDLSAVKTRLTNVETTNGDHETRIASAEGLISGLTTSTGNNATAIGELQSEVSALKVEDGKLSGLIDNLSTTKADASAVYTKKETDDKIQEVVDAIPEVDLAPYALKATVDQDIVAINAALATKAEADAVYTIVAADAKFLTQDQVDARINTLIDAADSADTITNVTNLVAYVHDNASDIAELVSTVGNNTTAIQQNTSAISTINSAINDINAGILAIVQPKASAEISVAADGTLGLIEVSTDKLKQGSKPLVLNGGSSAED